MKSEGIFIEEDLENKVESAPNRGEDSGSAPNPVILSNEFDSPRGDSPKKNLPPLMDRRKPLSFSAQKRFSLSGVRKAPRQLSALPGGLLALFGGAKQKTGTKSSSSDFGFPGMSSVTEGIKGLMAYKKYLALGGVIVVILPIALYFMMTGGAGESVAGTSEPMTTAVGNSEPMTPAVASTKEAVTVTIQSVFDEKSAKAAIESCSSTLETTEQTHTNETLRKEMEEEFSIYDVKVKYTPGFRYRDLRIGSDTIEIMVQLEKSSVEGILKYRSLWIIPRSAPVLCDTLGPSLRVVAKVDKTRKKLIEFSHLEHLDYLMGCWVELEELLTSIGREKQKIPLMEKMEEIARSAMNDIYEPVFEKCLA